MPVFPLKTMGNLIYVDSSVQQPAGHRYDFPVPLLITDHVSDIGQSYQHAGLANPLFIPIADPLCAWETVVDVVDDYFRIEREEPVRRMGDTLIEGGITTVPEVSPTVFEPWRRDTADYDQRVENTLQTMRRWARVRVIPVQGGHLVEMAVFKELEDVVKPEHATAGAATFRFDDSMTGVVDPLIGERIEAGWISRGRDASMEQYMLSHLASRCGQAGQTMAR